MATHTDRGESQPIHEIVVDQDVMIPMRDGTRLETMIWRPAGPGRYPVLVRRDPYDFMEHGAKHAEYFAPRGYVFLYQHTRGMPKSEGVNRTWLDDGWGANRDGYDTVEWAAEQPWSNGQVGTIGGSYSGCTQYLAAPTRPPHLRAMFVRQTSGDVHDLAFRGGAFKLALALFACMLGVHENVLRGVRPGTPEWAMRARLAKAIEEQHFWERHLPLNACPPLEEIPGAYSYLDWVAHPVAGPYWWPLALSTKYGEVDVPICHLDAWFDVFELGPLRAFQGIRAHGRTAHCRDNQRIVIGPWLHEYTQIGLRRAGELDFGPAAEEYDLHVAQLRWFDHWLKGIENGVMDGPPIRAFLMGHNRWLDLEEWPPVESAPRLLYLRQGAGASPHSLNSGMASFEPPDSAESADSYCCDPEDPIPSLVGYPGYAPVDYRGLEGRMLTYTTAPLERDLAVVGPVKAVLYGLSTAPDTDWVVRLCDVYPDGRSMSVCDGILRARYRNSLERQELMTPGQVYRFEVELLPTAQVFLAGHRIRVQVTSSDFPRYDRNLNTGGPFGEEVRGQVAINTLFHDRMRPSHVRLPVYPLKDAS